MAKQYAVFWLRGRRLGSCLLSELGGSLIEKEFLLRLIQRDITGTEHYEVVLWRKHPTKRPQYEGSLY